MLAHGRVGESRRIYQHFLRFERFCIVYQKNNVKSYTDALDSRHHHVNTVLSLFAFPAIIKTELFIVLMASTIKSTSSTALCVNDAVRIQDSMTV